MPLDINVGQPALMPVNVDRKTLRDALSDEIAGSSQFNRGWQSADLGEGAGDLMWKSNRAAASGDLEAAAVYEQQGRDLMRQAQQWAPTVRDFSDINSAGSAVDWAGGAMGNLRSSVKPALGGLAGAAVGGVGGFVVGGLPGAAAGANLGSRLGAGYAGYDVMTESNVAEMMTDSQIRGSRSAAEIGNAARVAGGVQGVLESIVPAGVVGSLVGLSGRKAAAEIAKNGLLKTAGKRVGINAAEEFATEFAQNPVGDVAKNYLKGEDLTNIDWKSALNAGAAGAVAGGGMGAMGAGFDAAHAGIGSGVDIAKDIAANPMQKIGDGIANLGGKLGEIKAAREGAADRKALQQAADRASATELGNLGDPFDPPAGVEVDGSVEADKAVGAHYTALADKVLKGENRDDYSQEDKQAAARFKTHGDWSTFRSEIKAARKSKLIGEIAAEFEGKSKSSMMWANPSQPKQEFEAKRTEHGETIGKLSEIMLNKNEGVRGLSSIKDAGEAGRKLVNNLMAWAAESYKIGTNEDNESVITVPRRFTSEIPADEAVRLVEESAKLVRAQGLVADPEQHKKDTDYVIRKIREDASLNAEPKEFVMQRLTPIAQDQVKTSQVPQLIKLLEKLNGEVGPETRKRLTELFGAATDEVINRFVSKAKYGKQIEGDERKAVSGVDEDGELTFDNEEETYDDATVYTSGSEDDNSVIGVGQDNAPFSRLTDLDKFNSVLGSFENRIDARAYAVGAVRRVRESMKGRPAEEIIDAENALVEANAEALKDHPTLGEAFASIAAGEFNPADMEGPLRQKVLTEINRNFQYIQVKKVKPDADPRKVKSTDFKHEISKADKDAGKTDADLTAGDGFVFLERDYMGNGKLSHFPVYMKRLLAADSRDIGNRENPDRTLEDKGQGIAGDYEHVQYMLSSLIDSGRGFTGRVGYREKAGDELVWLDKTFPDTLKLGNKGTVAQAKAQLAKERREDPGTPIAYAENHKDRVAALLGLAEKTESADFAGFIYSKIKKGGPAVLQLYRELRNQWQGEVDGFGGTPTGKDKHGVVDTAKRTSQRRAFNKNTDPSLADHSSDKDRVPSETDDAIQTGIRREDPSGDKPIQRNDDGSAAGLGLSALSASYGGSRSTNTGTKPVRYRTKGQKVADERTGTKTSAGSVQSGPALTSAGRDIDALTPEQKVAEAKLQQAQERVVELLGQGVEKLLDVIGGLDMKGLGLIDAALFGREPAITQKRMVTDSRYQGGVALRQYNSDGSGIKTKQTGEVYKSGVDIPGLADVGASAINRIIFDGKDIGAAQKTSASLIRHRAVVDAKIKARRTELENSDGELGGAGSEAVGGAGNTDPAAQEAGMASGQLRGQADRGGVDAPGLSGRGRPGEDRNSQRRADGASGGDVSASAEKVQGTNRGRAGSAAVTGESDSNRDAGKIASDKGGATADLNGVAKQDALGDDGSKSSMMSTEDGETLLPEPLTNRMHPVFSGSKMVENPAAPTVREVLDWIIQNDKAFSGNSNISVIVDSILASPVANLPVGTDTLSERSGRGGPEFHVVGRYTRTEERGASENDSEILRKLTLHTEFGTTVETFLHEVAHAWALVSLSDPVGGQKAEARYIAEIHKEAVRAWEKAGSPKNMAYAMRDPHELVSEYIGNPSVRDFLDNLKVSPALNLKRKVVNVLSGPLTERVKNLMFPKGAKGDTFGAELQTTMVKLVSIPEQFRWSNQTANNTTQRTKEETEKLKAETTAELHRLLGDDIKVDFKAFFKDGASGRWTPKQTGNIISLALNGDVLGTRYHEALHEFFNMLTKGGAENVKAQLLRVATNPIILKKLDRLLDGHPAAQAQVKNSPEEALAFAFQFWATGALKLGPDTKTFFQHLRDGIAAVAKKLYSLLDGTYRKEYSKEKAQKMDAGFADNVFKSFMAGNAGNKNTRQAFVDALKNNAEAHDKAIENLGTTVDAIYQKVGKMVFSAEAVLEQSNKYFAELAPVYHQQAGSAMKSFKDGQASGAVFESTQSVTAKWLNQLERVLSGTMVDGKFEPYEKADLELAVEGLQRQKRPTAEAAGAIYDKVLKYYDKMFDYLNESDVRRLDMDQIDEETGTHGKWVKMEKRQKYFTDLWDTETLGSKKDEFISDILKHHRKELEALAKTATKEAKDIDNNPFLDANTAADLERRRALDEFEASGKVVGKVNFKELTAEDVAEAIFMRLLNAEGKIDNDNSDTSLGLSPAASSINRRQLDWLNKDVFAKYKSKDLVRIMTTYTRSMVKRAEHQKRLGYGGEVVNTAVDKGFLFEMGGDSLVKRAEDTLPARVASWKKAKAKAIESGVPFDEPFPTLRLVGYSLGRSETMAEVVAKGGSEKDGLKAYADKLGAAAKKLQPALNAIRAEEGTLGSEISNGWRGFNSAATVYTQFRLLPLTLFTSFNDVVGIAVNGGDAKDAWNGFVSGIRAIKASWVGEIDESAQMKRAEAFGAVDAPALMESLGQSYGSSFMSDKARRASNWLFKVNGMQGWNRGVRAAAVTVAERAILDWAKNGVNMKDPAEVARFERLYGKGADPKGIQLDPDGNLDAMSDQNRAAVNRWVFDAVMSPNPAVRAIWMSDPRMQPFAMLKNFTYTMHRVMLKGVMEQAKLGNFRPALAAMAGYVPIAIAGGALKEMLIPGEEPPWMQGGLDDYLEYGFARAGLGGVPQMYLGDLAGGDPVGVLGPFVDQLRDLALSPVPEVRVNLSPFEGDSAFIKDRTVFGEVLASVNPVLKRAVQ